MIGAEAHAVFAQVGPFGLFQAFHLVGDARTLEHAERFDQLERDAAGNAADVGSGRQSEQRAKQFLDVGFYPSVEPRFDGLAGRAGQMFVGDDTHPRP